MGDDINWFAGLRANLSYGFRNIKMMKKYLSSIRVILVLILLIVAFVASYIVGSKSRYSTYIPPEDPFFRMTFEYPSEWAWHESRDNDILAGRRSIFSSNPVIALKTPDTQSGIHRDLYKGNIDIDVIAHESADKAKEKMGRLIRLFSDTNIVEGGEVSISDQAFKVDGYDARRIVRKVDLSKILNQEPFLEEIVFILVDNSIYTIRFWIWESERHGEYGQGIDHLVESVRFIRAPKYVDCQPADLPLREFQPEEGSLVKLAFSYPGNWDWKRSPNADKTYDAMYVLKPYMRILGITVWKSSNSRAEMGKDIDLYLDSVNAPGERELFSDSTIQIDGHDARWLTVTKIRERESPSTRYIRELVYLLDKDKYYIIDLYIPETEVDGCFHNEFKAMIESIEVLPK